MKSPKDVAKRIDQKKPGPLRHPIHHASMEDASEMLSVLAISGYRSLRSLVIPLARLNVVTGPNGSGKSNLYRALRLLADTAQGNVVQSLAQEGGLPSTVWAGPAVISRAMKLGRHPIEGARQRLPASLKLGFAGEFGYLIDMGYPPHSPASESMFDLDPDIKRECIWHGPYLRPAALLVDRRGPVVQIRREDGNWDIIARNLAGFDSMIARLADPRSAPEVLTLRESIRRWRFYDSFRTDPDAPARAPQIGTRTPVLSNDGRDLAAAIRTIHEVGDDTALASAVEDAFPGGQLSVSSANGRFVLQMKQHGLLRSLEAAELSDGTLRYLLWIAVLLTPRPPELMVLNEPETSLHPDLLPALARLIAQAAKQTQVIVVSHAAGLIGELGRQPGCHAIRLEKQVGETVLDETGEMAAVPWHWASR
jgi:predicted ATPase